MSALGTTSKGWLGVKATKGLAKNPGIFKLGAKAAPPVAKFGWTMVKPRMSRSTRRKAEQLGDVVVSALIGAPEVAEQLGLVKPPKPRRTAPRIAVGVLIGAGAMYFLEPGHGREHREQVRSLIG